MFVFFKKTLLRKKHRVSHRDEWISYFIITGLMQCLLLNPIVCLREEVRCPFVLLEST